VPHEHPRLLHKAKFVTITFLNQKNGKKMDSRTQKRTGRHDLCPVLRWGSAVKRVIATVPNYTEDTPISSIVSQSKTLSLDDTFILTLLRHTVRTTGGFDEYGFHPHEIGNKSIRSGAAMALFLNDHSTAKIMILGRWASDAFLVYIRPQVLEWTNTMSLDMARLDTFLDPSRVDTVTSDDPRTRKRLSQSFNGRDRIIKIPKLYLHH